MLLRFGVSGGVGVGVMMVAWSASPSVNSSMLILTIVYSLCFELDYKNHTRSLFSDSLWYYQKSYVQISEVWIFICTQIKVNLNRGGYVWYLSFDVGYQLPTDYTDMDKELICIEF